MYLKACAEYPEVVERVLNAAWTVLDHDVYRDAPSVGPGDPVSRLNGAFLALWSALEADELEHGVGS
ncbi:MAG TPA: hypothetical protein VGW38_01705 [Chloroflexota bacterium]|nr:hypothetical protein [Chloroflexota bacterium]